MAGGSLPHPALLPADANGRAIVRAMVATIATDVHPLHNLRTLKALRQDFGASDTQVNAWMGHWMGLGFAAFEALATRHGGTFCYGDTPRSPIASRSPRSIRPSGSA